MTEGIPQPLDLAALRSEDRQIYELMLEACSGKTALAGLLVTAIGAIATRRAVTLHRELLEAHLQLAEEAGPQGPAIACRALRDGVPFRAAMREYRQASEQRGDKTLRIVK